MRKIGFRRLLPAINVIIYLALMYTGFAESFAYVSQRATAPPMRAALVNSAWQESGQGWEPKTMCYFVPTAHWVAYAINFPAYVFGSAIGSLLWRAPKLWRLQLGTFWGENTFIAGCTMLLVPVIWFYVGRWIDRRVGFRPAPQFRASRVAKFFRLVSALGSVAALITYLGLLAYAIATIRGQSAGDWAPFLCISFWVVFLSLATVSNVRGARQQRLAAKNA